MTRARGGSAGVTLVEMLVVLALFALVSGAVALSLPLGRGATSADTDARALQSHLNRAMEFALVTGSSFGVMHDGKNLRFVHLAITGDWAEHPDKQLKEVKLSLATARTSIKAQEVFAVSARLIPATATPLNVQFGADANIQTVMFDGTRAVRRKEH